MAKKLFDRFHDRPIRYIVLVLGACTLISLLLLLHNLSTYKVYPDSYTSLVVANNLKQHLRLVAPMGPNGLVYPDFVSWTRPAYPALIALLGSIGMKLPDAAQVIAIFAALLSIVFVFFLVRAFLRSTAAALAGSLLLAVSYNHTVWSGFILTESLGVLAVILAVWQLWRRRERKSGWFVRGDILTGLFFAIAILTRYEYAILLVPAIIWASRKWAPARSTTILLTSLVSTGLILAILRPFTGGFAWVWHQIGTNLILWLVGIVAAFAIGMILPKLKVSAKAQTNISYVLISLITTGVIALFVNHNIYLGLWQFCTHDWLIASLATIGLILMLARPQWRNMAAFLISSITLLGFIYYQANPLMDRYLTHLLPFLMIAASYTIYRLLTTRYRTTAIVILLLAFGLQGYKSYQGLHSVRSDWFGIGYEEQAAGLALFFAQPNMTIIAAQPEPYAISSPLTILSVAAQPPYIDLKHAKPTQVVLLVDDEAMRQNFPEFESKIVPKLAPYPHLSFPGKVPFHFRTTTITNPKPVTVYRLTASQLKCLVEREANTSEVCK